MTVPFVGITAAGSALPEQVLTTAALQQKVASASGLELPSGMFERVSGIASRRVAHANEFASTLAIVAARAALTKADLDPLDIDLLLFASATRDVAEPATAHIVQAELGSEAHALDVTNACNSFINGIDLAHSVILAGKARRVLVVTGETPTRAMRPKVTGIRQARMSFAGYTFGDAGAAVVVEGKQNPAGMLQIVDVETETQSRHWPVGGIAGGGSRHPRGDEHTYFHGDGLALRGVFEKIGTGILERVFTRTGLDWPEFSKVLVHQVTLPYLDRFVEVSGVPRSKLDVTVSEFGNVASATLGLQLDRVAADLAVGDRVLLVGLGGGVSVMTMVLERR